MTTVLIVFFVLAIVMLFKLSVVKGWIGEKITSGSMWALLDEDEYRRIDDLIVPCKSSTTQIDHVLVSEYGIFVIETKNIKGWIFGSPESDKWTQSIYGNKKQFQNPLKQNYRHVRCLREYLGIDERLFRPVVFFIGDCKFKTPMPSNVLNGGLIPYIKSFSDKFLEPKQIEDIGEKLLALKSDPSLNRQTHLNSLQARHQAEDVCPRCGKPLIKRVAKRGRLSGEAFWGCSGFPGCKFTRPV